MEQASNPIQRLMTRLNMKQNSTTLPISQLMTICSNIKIDIDKETAKKYEGSILNAYDSMVKCQDCKLSAFDAHDKNCCMTKIEIIDGKIYETSCLCDKVMAHLKALNMGKIIESTGIGKRFRQRTFDNFKVTDKNKQVFDICKRFADNFTKDTKGILLTGGYGTGKTHLSASIINELLDKNIVGAFVVVPDLLRAIRQSFDDKENQELKTLFDTIRKAEILVLDDLGSEKSNDWVREQLFILINSRYENMLPTIITTNLKPAELAKDEVLGKRIMSRINEMTVSILLDGDDYRYNK